MGPARLGRRSCWGCPGSGRALSRPQVGFKRTIADLHRTFPDLSVCVEEQRAEGDTVTTRCVLCGTDRGGVLWYPPTNKRAIFTDTFTDRFSGGKLVEHCGESDMEGLLRQLGLSSLRGDEATP